MIIVVEPFGQCVKIGCFASRLLRRDLDHAIAIILFAVLIPIEEIRDIIIASYLRYSATNDIQHIRSQQCA